MSLRLDPQRFFPPIRRSAASRPNCSRQSKNCRSSARTAIPIPPGSADDAPFEDAVSLLLWPDHYLLRLLYSAGRHLRASASRRRTARRRGGNGPAQDLAAVRRSLSLSSAARPAAPGWITPSWTCSGWTAPSGRRPRTIIMTRSTRNWPAGIPPARLVRALQYRGDRHHRKFPGSARSIMKRSRPRAGRGGSSPPSAPTKSPIPITRISPPSLRRHRRVDRRGHDATGRAI